MKSFLSLAALALLVSGCSQPPASTALQDSGSERAGEFTGITETAHQVQQRSSSVRLVSAPQTTATLTAKFVFDGKAPAPAKEAGTGNDPFCAGLDIFSQKMLIGEKGEIRNLAMYLTDADEDLPEVPLPKEKPVLDNKNCLFVPHVMSVRAGQTMTVTNSDPTGHNADFGAVFNNEQVNFLIPSNQSKDYTWQADEPAPIPVKCSIHPWMVSYIIVTEHPFVGITDENGVLTIENLPVGKVEFKVWHENSKKSLDEATVNGETQKWRRGRAEFELKPGMNDLGTIVLSPELFDN